MKQDQTTDDFRERLIGALTSPWAPLTAGVVFLLAIGLALVSVMMGSRTEDERDTLVAIVHEARAGNHLQASQLALTLRQAPNELPKLLEWFYFSDPDTPLENIDLPTLSAFIDANQHWPGALALEIKREVKLAETRPPAEMLAYFADHPPVTKAAQRRHLVAQLVLPNGVHREDLAVGSEHVEDLVVGLSVGHRVREREDDGKAALRRRRDTTPLGHPVHERYRREQVRRNVRRLHPTPRPPAPGCVSADDRPTGGCPAPLRPA